MDLASMSAAELAALAEQVHAAQEALEARDAHAAQEVSESEDDTDLDARFVPREKDLHENEVTIKEDNKNGTILYPAEYDYGHLENGLCAAPVMCVGYMPFQQSNPRDGSGEKRVAVHNSLLFQPGDRKPRGFAGTYEDLARLWAAGVRPSVLTELRRGCVFSWVPSDPAPAWLTERLPLHSDDTFEYLMLCFALNVRPWIPFMGIMFREFTGWLAGKWLSERGASRARAIFNFNERCLKTAKNATKRNPTGKCRIPGCHYVGSEFDHRACTRLAPGDMCKHHNTGIAAAYEALGARRAIAMAERSVGHVKSVGERFAVARGEGEEPQPTGPEGGFY